MPSQINPNIPIAGDTPGPSTESVRRNFTVARDEVSDLQARLSENPATPLTTSLVLAWRNENGTLQPLGRVMLEEPDPAIGGGRWLYLAPP